MIRTLACLKYFKLFFLHVHNQLPFWSTQASNATCKYTYKEKKKTRHEHGTKEKVIKLHQQQQESLRNELLNRESYDRPYYAQNQNVISYQTVFRWRFDTTKWF